MAWSESTAAVAFQSTFPVSLETTFRLQPWSCASCPEKSRPAGGWKKGADEGTFLVRDCLLVLFGWFRRSNDSSEVVDLKHVGCVRTENADKVRRAMGFHVQA